MTHNPNESKSNMSSRVQQRICATSFFVALMFAMGCGSPEKKYIPAASTGRAALETALEFWKSGNVYGPVEDFDVPIDLLDSRWQKGRKLESYEILGEEKAEGPKVFTVKMKLDEDKEEKEVKYFVFGKDPLHVWREQDYKANTGS